jgi:hypothetical protein
MEPKPSWQNAWANRTVGRERCQLQRGINRTWARTANRHGRRLLRLDGIDQRQHAGLCSRHHTIAQIKESGTEEGRIRGGEMPKSSRPARARGKSPSPVVVGFFGRIVPSDATTESDTRFAQIPKMKIASFRGFAPRKCNLQTSFGARNRLAISSLGVVHRRLDLGQCRLRGYS